MIHTLRKAMLAASCFLILCGPPAWAVPYTFTTLDFPPVDIGVGTVPVTRTLPTTINLQGQIVGSFFISLGAASEQRMGRPCCRFLSHLQILLAAIQDGRRLPGTATESSRCGPTCR